MDISYTDVKYTLFGEYIPKPLCAALKWHCPYHRTSHLKIPKGLLSECNQHTLVFIKHSIIAASLKWKGTGHYQY